MAIQIACVISAWTGDGVTESYRPLFVNNMASSEDWAFDAESLINKADLRESVGDALASVETHQAATRALTDAVLGVGIVYVVADSVRLDSAHASANYHVFWRYTVDRNDALVASEASPIAFPISDELVALRDFLAARTGKPANTITSWLKNHFGVASNAEVVTWSTGRNRYFTITKLGVAFYDWSVAKGELDAL